MKRRPWVLVLVLPLLLSTVRPAIAQTVRIAGLTLPADCALAKNERPRLLFRGRDLAKYKARLRGVMKDDFERFKRYWDAKLAKKERCDHLCLAVLYQLTGERRYADAIRNDPEFRKPGRFYQRAFTFDLIFDTLTPEEVKREADFFLANADKKFRWSAQMALWPALALHGAKTGREEEIDKWLARGYKAAKAFSAQCNRWAEHRGGDVNSFSYVGNHSVLHMGGHLLAFENALGEEDVWEKCPWARHIGSYYVYHFFPWRRAAIHFDNTTGLNAGPRRGSLGAAFCLARAAGKYRDGLAQWWLYHLLVHQDPVLKGWPKVAQRNRVMTGLWARILYYDPTVPMREPKDFPPSRFFLTRGFASMRENWSTDATFVHFRCGRFGGLGDKRHNADQNTFTIYRKGILALDTGGQHALDAGRLKLQPGKDHHCVNYSGETIAHNSVLVHHPVDDAAWKKYGKLNTGGQFLRGRPRSWAAARGYKDPRKFPAGVPLAWETSPEYDYACGDATNSYSPATCKSFVRQIVYVRPNLVFLFDRVETAREGCRTTWLLHTADKPTADGEETPDKRIHPEGHFLWTGDTATVTDERMGGRMFCRTLLPEKREVRLLGGKFHDFELPDGRNIGPTEATYTSKGLGRSRALGEGVAGWRIEIEDRTGARSVRFLHVFETTDRTQVKMAPCEIVRKGAAVGARVTTKDGTVEVVFNDTGKTGGHVTITKADRPVVDRDLATEIEDHYDRWKLHPDYEKWMSDPFRRSVVLGVNP